MFNIASLRFVRLPREDFSEGETMEKISAFSDGDLSDIYAYMYDNAYNNTYIHMCVQPRNHTEWFNQSSTRGNAGKQ